MLFGDWAVAAIVALCSSGVALVFLVGYYIRWFGIWVLYNLLWLLLLLLYNNHLRLLLLLLLWLSLFAFLL